MPSPGRAYTPVELGLRLLRSIDIDPETDCWIWQGAPTRNGYAQMRLDTSAGGRKAMVHRVSHELFIGPIPPRWTVDHVRARGCHSTLCVSPDHLQAVPHKVNLARSSNPFMRSHLTNRCKRDHDLTRTGHVNGASGRRQCRECQNQLRREARQRAKEGATQ